MMPALKGVHYTITKRAYEFFGAIAVREAMTGRPDRLAFSETEAAEMLGIKKHVLRDCRYRGEIQASKVGSKIRYSHKAIQDFLSRQEFNGPLSG